MFREDLCSELSLMWFFFIECSNSCLDYQNFRLFFSLGSEYFFFFLSIFWVFCPSLLVVGVFLGSQLIVGIFQSQLLWCWTFIKIKLIDFFLFWWVRVQFIWLMIMLNDRIFSLSVDRLYLCSMYSFKYVICLRKWYAFLIVSLGLVWFACNWFTKLLYLHKWAVKISRSHFWFKG